jgi:hypothetical protein
VLVGSRNLQHGETTAKSVGRRPAPSSSTSRIRPPSMLRQSASGPRLAVSPCW